MAIAPGTRFGPYEIAESIGAGGMGEVYRAADTNLKRDVAIKILPKAFVDDADRVARFQREAEALAALNHPNIAQVYGLELAEGNTAIVMELVEGPTLAERIAQGAIPYDDALAIARQMIAALEAAHGKGIVHRDLKPANVKVRQDGTVKVLDFGIATAPESPLATSGKRSPALLTPALTEAGILLGTAAYMAPEQARGRPVDERADVWAFGCVLYEMLTGQPAFTGEDVTTTLARVLEREANLGALPSIAPSSVRHTLELCLEKDPNKRIADIRDVRLALEARFETEGSDGRATAVQPAWRRLMGSAAVLIIGVALTGLAAWGLRPVPDTRITRFSVDLAGPLIPFQSIALSPDGRRIVYQTNGQLYSQRLDQNEATVIPGTEEGQEAFFSPDGELIAFFTGTQLKTVGFAGEIPRVVANIGEGTAPGLVGAWGPDDQLFFGQGGPYGLSSVPVVGGELEPFADLADYRDLDYPDVLPGGDWVLFAASKTVGNWSSGDVIAQNAATGEQKIVLESGHFARYLPTGHLAFARNATLYAVAFDPQRLETRGPAVPVVQGIATDETSGHAKFAVAANGTLIYVPGVATGGDGQSAVVRVDREGAIRAFSSELRNYGLLRVSPNGTHLAVEVTESSTNVHIWIMDLATGAATQLTLEGSRNRFPVWTPDSRDVLFTSDRDAEFAIYRQAADGTGEPVRVFEGTDQLAATEVLTGNVLLYQDTGEAGYRDILTYDLDDDGPATPFLATPEDERSARVSPSGAWVVYVSDAGNVVAPRLYARPYPRASGGLRALSEGNGAAPIWLRSGEEIYFVGPPPSGLMTVPVASTPTTITPGRPEELFGFVGRFRVDTDVLSTAPYDVMPNGDGIVAVQLAGLSALEQSEDAARPRIRVVLNWFEELKRLVPSE